MALHSPLLNSAIAEHLRSNPLLYSWYMCQTTGKSLVSTKSSNGLCCGWHAQTLSCFHQYELAEASLSEPRRSTRFLCDCHLHSWGPKVLPRSVVFWTNFITLHKSKSGANPKIILLFDTFLLSLEVAINKVDQRRSPVAWIVVASHSL